MRRGRGRERAAIVIIATVGATGSASIGALPTGRPHVLTIKGDNTLTFVPAAGLPPLPIDDKARVEYREWTSARWSVAIETKLASQGATIAHGRGTMIVELRALDIPPSTRDRKARKRTTGGTAAPGAASAPG